MNKANEIKYFAYCRKSSEDSKKQIASIQDQKDSVSKIVDLEGLNLVREPFSEERSSKDPGRPVFNDMLNRIEKGEANGVICWDIDRLYRNPVDEGRLRWMLQKGVIKVIRTPYRSFYPEDAGLLMGVEGGRATDYVIRLSKNVKRGLDSRAAKGWRPNCAPIGYINIGEEGDRTIVADPDKFDLIRKMWGLLLTGVYSPSKIRDMANDEWGIRTKITKKQGGKKLSLSHVYAMFNDPFYSGYFWWTDKDTGERKLHKGNHPAMVTDQEFVRARMLLGKKGKQQPKTREFPFTGVMKCGECGLNITAEVKQQIICSVCKNKFSSIKTTTCPKCHTDSSEMSNPKILEYVYYHCTRHNKNSKKCEQKSLKLEELEKQFNTILGDIKFDDEYLQIALDYLHMMQKESGTEEKVKRKSLQAVYDACQVRLKSLEREYTSPQNAKYEIFTTEEYIQAKKAVIAERDNIKVEAGKVEGKFDESIERSARVFNFCIFAREVFNGDDLQLKRAVFSTIGSNLTIKDQKLFVEKLHPYLLIENEIRAQKKLFEALEPEKEGYAERRKVAFDLYIPSWLPDLESNQN